MAAGVPQHVVMRITGSDAMFQRDAIVATQDMAAAFLARRRPQHPDTRRDIRSRKG